VRVSIRDDDELVAGAAEAEIQPFGLAAVDRVVHHLQAWVAGTGRSGNGCRSVARAVVEHEDLELGVVKGQRCTHARTDHFLLVEGRNEHGHARPASRRRRGIVGLVEKPEQQSARNPYSRRHNREQRDVREQDLSDWTHALSRC
jgi:hypothetical protein